MRIGIVGSCVSRDLFSRVTDLAGHFTLGPYISRASLISMVSMPMPKSYIDPSEISTRAFDDRRFMQDLEKSYWRILSDSPSDILIIDLIDERHATFALDGVAVTYTKSARPYLDPLLEQGRGVMIKPFTKVWENYMFDSLSRFADLIKNSLPEESVCIVHHARYATRYLSPLRDSKIDFPAHQQESIHKWNQFLDAAHERLSEELCAYSLRSSVPDDDIIAGGDHLWDLTPFHYDYSYYKKLAAELVEFASECKLH
jgi:Family of unknown function (DUF6270)